MKNLLYSFLFFFAIGFTLFSCSSEDDTTITDEEMEQMEDNLPLEASVELDVSYGDDPEQVYDIYLPANRSVDRTKVIVLIHGGGWTGGDKADMSDFIPAIQAQHPNHAVVNINYVLASYTPPLKSAFPNQFLDIGLVLNKIATEKETLQVLPEFGLIGTSAGAHLALMYDYVYDRDDSVKFVADIVGPTNFYDPFFANNPTFQLALDILVDESSFPEGTDYASAVSPALNVSGDSSPTLLFYGNKDPLVPLSNGYTLDINLSASQITHSFTIYDGGHGDDWSAADRINLQTQIDEYIIDFLPVPEQ